MVNLHPCRHPLLISPLPLSVQAKNPQPNLPQPLIKPRIHILIIIPGFSDLPCSGIDYHWN